MSNIIMPAKKTSNPLLRVVLNERHSPQKPSSKVVVTQHYLQAINRRSFILGS